MRRLGRLALAGWLCLGLTASAPADDFIVPTDGLDVVHLKDGRVLRCKCGTPDKKRGKVEIAFTSDTFTIDSDRIERVRYFRDFDSTPRTKDDEERAARGLVRWNGKWVRKDQAEKALQKALAGDIKAREADAEHAAWKTRWILETRHFRIESNVTRAKLDEYALLLEDYYKHFARHFHVQLKAKDRARKFLVLVFRTREGYLDEYRASAGEGGEHTLGYFSPRRGEEKLVLYDQPKHDETLDTLFHEGTHFILHMTAPKVQLPRWIHEGCAEYYAGATYERRRFTSGEIQDGRLLEFQGMIEKGEVIPIKTLMARSGDRFDSKCYAQAWTLVHFFKHGQKGKYGSRFQGYLKKWLTGRSVKYTIESDGSKYLKLSEDVELLLKSLKVKTFDVIEKELAEYAKTLRLVDAAAYVHRGARRLWDDDDEEGAQRDFDLALERGGDDPTVLAWLAYTYNYTPGKEGEAPDLYERSLELDPLNATVRYDYAMTLDPLDMVPHLRLCMEIAPEYPDPPGDLAWQLFLSIGGPDRAENEEDVAQVDEALKLVARAIELDPSHRHLDTMAALLFAKGDFEGARRFARRAVRMKPYTQYVVTLAKAEAMLGDAAKYAVAMLKGERIVKNAARNERRDDRAAVAQFLAEVVLRTADASYVWEREAQCLKALIPWFDKRSPTTEEEYLAVSLLFQRADDPKRAAEFAKKGLAAFPGSSGLEDVLEYLE